MKIFVTRNIPEVGLNQLKAAGHEVVVNSQTDSPLDERLRAENPDAVLCLLTDQITDSVLAAAPRAKIFANYAVGFDNIDLEAAKARGIAITNTPDVLTEAVAEHAAALILSLVRRVVESDRFARAGRYHGWDPLLLLGTELRGQTLGIAGSGRIGARLAEIMHRGFDMKISYYDREPRNYLEEELGAVFMPDLAKFLASASVVSIHLPLTTETRHLFNQKHLSEMRPGSLLINTARGAIIDEAALVTILKEGPLAGAALDVFENEPTIHPDLLALDNIILTPHVASATREAREAMSLVAANNIISVLRGEVPLNLVS